MTTLSVVVPATDEPETLARCLAAIRAAVTPPEEIIVVDSPKHAGPAEARNLGAAKASQDVIVFVDADVEVAADAFERIRSSLGEGSEFTALFGSYDDTPLDPGVVSGFRNLLHHYVHYSSPGPASTFWAGLGAIRRDVFLAVGGFNAQRFPLASVEDIELGMRLVSNGKRILLDPRIQGKHLKRWTLGSMVQTDLLRRGAPWVRLLLDRSGGSKDLNLGWRHRASAAASVGITAGLVTRRPKLLVGSGTFLVALNAGFYILLYERRGLRQTAIGIPLHVLHHLVSVLAVPVGLAQHIRAKSAQRSET